MFFQSPELVRIAGEIITRFVYVLTSSKILILEIEQKTVSTPISTRYPAEDTTLAYAYDNQALAVTPVNEKPRGTETAF